MCECKTLLLLLEADKKGVGAYRIHYILNKAIHIQYIIEKIKYNIILKTAKCFMESQSELFPMFLSIPVQIES